MGRSRGHARTVASGQASRQRLEALGSEPSDLLMMRAPKEPQPDSEALTAAVRLGRQRPWIGLGILVLLALVVTATVVWRGSPKGVEVAGAERLEVVAAGSPVASGAPIGAGPEGLSETAKVVVHVVGRVRRPGVVTLPAGSRLVDAVAAAGGLAPGTPLSGVNLASPLVDGQQVRVGLPAVPSPADPALGAGSQGAASVAPGSPVSLNAATAEELDTLPRVGPATAEKIIDYRSRHGPFTSVEQLLDIPGIGEATLAGLRDRIRV